VKPTFVNGTSIFGATAGFRNADRVGALFQFPATVSVVKSKIGVSWMSTEKACQFLNEIPSWDLDKTIKKAEEAWEDEILSKIEITGEKNDTLLTMFYSALYRTAILPSNRTGENPFWDDGVGYVDDICKWNELKVMQVS
jgi:putative alpha-1,2-mannosidase